MWPTTKIISIHTYIIERNTYIGEMGGASTHFPFPLSLLVFLGIMLVVACVSSDGDGCNDLVS